MKAGAVSCQLNLLLCRSDIHTVHLHRSRILERIACKDVFVSSAAIKSSFSCCQTGMDLERACDKTTNEI